MATTVTKVVDPNEGTGWDYHSLSDWEVAQQGDLTGVRNEIAVAKCRCTGGTADTTKVFISGWITSSTQYIKVWTDPTESYRHNGTYQTGNKYRLELTSDGTDGGLTFDEPHTQIIGLQLQYTVSASNAWGIYALNISVETGTVTIAKNVIKGVVSGTPDNVRGICAEWATACSFFVYDNIVYDFKSGATTNIVGIRQAGTYSTNTSYFYNNTMQNCYTGFSNGNGNAKALNNLVRSCTVAAAGTFIAGSGYNVTDLASMGYTVTGGATGDRLSKSFTFANEGADDFHLVAADTDSIGYALNLYDDAVYPFQDDIDGQDRGGAAAAWDIGADEYVSSATLDQEGFRARNDDGNEADATFAAVENAPLTAPEGTMRFRFQLNNTGDPAAITPQFDWELKPSGGAWGTKRKIR